jgi:hypothetical protein
MTNTPNRAAVREAMEALRSLSITASAFSDNPKVIENIERWEAEIRALLSSALQGEEDQPSEWFFRWIARGKGGHTPMENAVDMIWHHPGNPYAEKNPWQQPLPGAQEPAQTFMPQETLDSMGFEPTKWPQEAGTLPDDPVDAALKYFEGQRVTGQYFEPCPQNIRPIVIEALKAFRTPAAAQDGEAILALLPEHKPDTRAELPDTNFQDSDVGREEAAYVRAKNHGWNLAAAIMRVRIEKYTKSRNLLASRPGWVLVPEDCRKADLQTGAFDGFKGNLEDAYTNVQNYIDWAKAAQGE